MFKFEIEIDLICVQFRNKLQAGHSRYVDGGFNFVDFIATMLIGIEKQINNSTLLFGCDTALIRFHPLFPGNGDHHAEYQNRDWWQSG